MADLNWTPLRHRILAMANRATFEQYCVKPMARNESWKLRQVGGVLGGPESRGLHELVQAGFAIARLQNRLYAPRPIERTEKGLALLDQWNETYGCIDRGIGNHDCTEHGDPS